MHTIARTLVVIVSLTAFASIATPALALCKYGTPHCINKDPGPKLPTVNTAGLPDAPPGNEDCKYYGNCDDGTPEGTGPDGEPNGGLGDTPAPALTGGQHSHLFGPSLGMLRR